ncbi:MAG TPA: hypothetical protein VGZ02_04130, partial [Candidatus Baltobacteraceae bacterium]|nr:hypothetical protein [Candidatus Baltobacteraceae bacterium]
NQIAIFDGHGGAKQFGSNALAVAVNSSGTILYDIYNGISLDCREGTFTIALYPSNATVPYPSNQDNDYGAGGGFGINDRGDVVGFYRDSNFNTAGFYYHNGSSIELLPAGYSGEGTGFVALGINNAEIIVGRAGPNATGSPHAFAWSNGVFTDLNSVLGADCRDWTITSAQAVNNHGYIIGTAQLGNDEHGVILVPRP